MGDVERECSTTFGAFLCAVSMVHGNKYQTKASTIQWTCFLWVSLVLLVLKETYCCVDG